MKDNKNQWYLLIYGGEYAGNSCIQDENIISVVVAKRFKISGYEAYEYKNGDYKLNEKANFKIIEIMLSLLELLWQEQ